MEHCLIRARLGIGSSTQIPFGIKQILNEFYITTSTSEDWWFWWWTVWSMWNDFSGLMAGVPARPCKSMESPFHNFHSNWGVDDICGHCTLVPEAYCMVCGWHILHRGKTEVSVIWTMCLNPNYEICLLGVWMQSQLLVQECMSLRDSMSDVALVTQIPRVMHRISSLADVSGPSCKSFIFASAFQKYYLCNFTGWHFVNWIRCCKCVLTMILHITECLYLFPWDSFCCWKLE